MESLRTELENNLKNLLHQNPHMDLKLEIEVERKFEIQDEVADTGTEKVEKVWEPFSLIPLLTDSSDYMIVNPSGMGKTIFLTYLGLLFLDKAENTNYLPINLTCQTLNARGNYTVKDYIKKIVEETYSNSFTTIQSNLENLCVLLDSLDQATNIDEILTSLTTENKGANYSHAKIIITMRENTASRVSSRFKKIRLKLPEENEVRKYLGQLSYEKLEFFIKSDKEMVTIPVLLGMMKDVVEKGDISKIINRTSLYNEFINVLIKEEKKKYHHSDLVNNFIDSRKFEEYIEKIAFYSLSQGEIQKINPKYIYDLFDCIDSEKESDKKRVLLNIGVITELLEINVQYSFRHLSFQAYFAARFMRRMLNDPSYEVDLFFQVNNCTFFNNDIWNEVIRFYIGLEKNPQKAAKILNSIYDADEEEKLHNYLRLLFAATFVPESCIEEKEAIRIYAMLHQLLEDRLYNSVFEVYIGDFKFFTHAQKLLFYEHFILPLMDTYIDSVNLAIKIISRIGIKEAIPKLNTLLNDGNEDIAHTAAQALAVLSVHEVIKPFLHSNSWYLRRVATESITKLEVDEAIALLKPLLYSSDEKWNAINILGDIGTSEAIELIFPYIKDDDINIRKAAATALGRIGSPEVVTLLKPLLYDSDKDYRAAAIKSFGEIRSREAIELIKLLHDDIHWFVRGEVALSLGKIGLPDAKKPLKKLAMDEEWYVRESVARAIDNIGSPIFLEELRMLIYDSNEYVSTAALNAFGKIGSEKEFTFIEPFLTEENLYDNQFTVIEAAIKAAGLIGSKDAVELIKPLLNFDYLKESAINALSDIGIDAFPTLKSLLNYYFVGDHEEHVLIIMSLGKIQTLESIACLESMIRFDYLKPAIITALSQIGMSEALPILLRLVNDDDMEISEFAAYNIVNIYIKNSDTCELDISDLEEYNAFISIRDTSMKNIINYQSEVTYIEKADNITINHFQFYAKQITIDNYGKADSQTLKALKDIKKAILRTKEPEKKNKAKKLFNSLAKAFTVEATKESIKYALKNVHRLSDLINTPQVHTHIHIFQERLRELLSQFQ